MTRGTAWALLRPVTRTLPWTALAGGGALGLLLLSVPIALSLDPDVDFALYLLRMAALAGALGAAFVLDDPARSTTEVLPVRRLPRQGLRLALVLPPVAAWWAAACALARAGAGPDGAEIPFGAATVEAAALFAVALGVAAGTVRFTGATSPGLAAGGAVLALAVAAAVLPADLALVVPTEHDRWEEAHRVWAGVLALALVTWTIFAREPAGRRPV
ncbi:ABC transporter [Actinomadura vinacea]|uniref:ABC transporter n=1 Tax=Actinomadura vinacea TaxID=115336 RepID=A0ABP5WK62_9ACTN